MREGGDLLILLLDINLFTPEECQTSAAPKVQPRSMLEQVLYFVSAYLMLNDHNHLAVYAVQEDACHLLHLFLGDETPRTPEFGNPTRNITSKLLSLLQQQAEAAKQKSYQGQTGPSTTVLSGALSRALCLLHRLRSSTPRASEHEPAATRSRPRILCLVGSPDTSKQYIPVMNAIFSAQRAEVAVDALVLGPPGNDSAFLQQAAHLTGGLYLKAAGPSRAGGVGASTGGDQQQQNAGAALQYLLSCFSADTATRAMLRVHQPQGVDFRASCFCHKKPVDLGYVCSVCLSIFCRPTAECVICGAAFGHERAGVPANG